MSCDTKFSATVASGFPNTRSKLAPSVLRWGYGSEADEACGIFDLYAKKGGNFLDTADFYPFGKSEELVSYFVATARPAAPGCTPVLARNPALPKNGRSMSNSTRNPHPKDRSLSENQEEAYAKACGRSKACGRRTASSRSNGSRATDELMSYTGLPGHLHRIDIKIKQLKSLLVPAANAPENSPSETHLQ